MLEKDIERNPVAGVHKLGGAAYKFVSPGQDGVPDRLVILPRGRIIFVELKTVSGRASSLQIVQQRRLKALGCDVRMLFGPDQVDDFLREVGEEVRRHEVHST